jgi:hypothetical protein
MAWPAMSPTRIVALKVSPPRTLALADVNDDGIEDIIGGRP